VTTATIDTLVAGPFVGSPSDLFADSFADSFETGGKATAAAGADILLESALTGADGLPCRLGDAELWFSETVSELEAAKALCLECPAKAACLAGAQARREPWGVWGGEIFERGVVIARKRPRGRPRKDASVIAA
jgi:WhiB family redox-sensing transcriptional regulator